MSAPEGTAAGAATSLVLAMKALVRSRSGADACPAEDLTRVPGASVLLPGDLERLAYGEPDVRIVIRSAGTVAVKPRRLLWRCALRWRRGASGLRVLGRAAARTGSIPTTPRRWPARRRRWPPCTSRRTSCSTAGSTPTRSGSTSLRGYPVVVNVWASWCGPCRFEFPHFQRAAAAYGKRVAFLGIDSQDSDDAAATFLREEPVPYPSYTDPDEEIADEHRRHARSAGHRLLRPPRRAGLPQTGALRRRRRAARRHRALRPRRQGQRRIIGTWTSSSSSPSSPSSS